MKRWNSKRKQDVENAKIDAFLADILEVYKKHGLSIGHEDGHGAFLIQPLEKWNVDWLQAASDDTEAA